MGRISELGIGGGQEVVSQWGKELERRSCPTNYTKGKEEPTFSWGGKTTIILKNDSVVNL